MPLTTLEGLHRATAHGADIRYFRVGSGRPIVLLHTLRTQLDYFGALLQHLDTRQVEVIAIDLPGHGESSAPRVDYTRGVQKLCHRRRIRFINSICRRLRFTRA